ncbi:cytochrome P450 [Coprinellus micaceus]|uniref:Cytochrome P450 n=1 Tax=Coprinellus micaceus TaxID=71717 RepID=A0A4Y7S6X7_COPMI|nr:cytochrome P450 [Coprinellus micaceus]
MVKKKTISAPKAKTTSDGLPDGISIRRYEDADWDEVCKLYWKGACVGTDSAMEIGMRNLHLQPISVAAYYLFATGVAAMYLQPTWVTAYFDPTIGGAVACFAAAAWVIYWRWQLRKSIWDACKAAWKDDMKDISKHYAFEKSTSKNDGGVSGFWVAEESQKDGKKVVVGCVGLDSRTQGDKSVSEVRRLTVSPVEKEKKKRAGLKKLASTTTTYQPAAWELFRQSGWKEVEKTSSSSFIRKIYDYKMELELTHLMSFHTYIFDRFELSNDAKSRLPEARPYMCAPQHGPPAAALTDYYITYYDIFKGGEWINQLRKLHERYGPVVRVGPNKLHFSDPSANPWFYDAWVSYTSSFGCTDIKGARERRSLLHPFFSRRSVLRLEPVIQETVDRFISSMKQNRIEGNVINIFHGLQSISLEVITTFCFAKRFDAIDYPGVSTPILGHFSSKWLVKIIAPQSLAFPAFTRTLGDQIDAILEEPTLLEKAEQETIYHHLLNPKSGQQLTTDALQHEANTLVAAGTDTVANIGNMAMFQILNNKDKLEKLPYLTAVVQESLRLGHGVVTPMPRIAAQAKSIGVVAMSVVFVHTNPDIFPQPLKFDPDRWLKETSSGLHNYLVAFSKGPRQCIGMTLGWAELYLIIGNLVRRIDLELVDTTKEDVRMEGAPFSEMEGPSKG